MSYLMPKGECGSLQFHPTKDWTEEHPNPAKCSFISHPLDSCHQPRHSQPHPKNDAESNSWLGTVPNLGISEEYTGWPGKGQTQDLSKDLRRIQVTFTSTTRGTITVTETIHNSHAGYTVSACIQLFLSGMESSSSKWQSLSGRLKSSLMTKNGTRDQIKSNSKKCGWLVRKQMH